MMLKANGEYLDFNAVIDVESQVKLFEDVETINGDFSYNIDLEDNGFNRKVLGIPLADTVKIIYQYLPSEVVDDSGQTIYTGKLQVNRIEGGFISSTFFSGNSEWFAELSESMSSLPLYRYDVDFTESNIIASFSENTGIVFPIIDTGALVTRSYANFKVEDFTGCFYVKTLFNEIFNPKGIKVEGDFINDPLFQKLGICSNGRSQEQVRNRSTYVNKTTAQNGIGAVDTVVTFQDETTFPYFDGSQDNFDITVSKYTADIRMRIKVDVSLSFSAVGGGPNLSAFDFYLHKNGVFIPGTFGNFLVNTTGGILSRTASISLEAGDTLEVVVRVTAFNNLNIASGSLKITPTYLYKVFGVASVPKWTQMEFVSNIIRLFNILPSYEPISKTLTLDFFNNIKNKSYVDLSNEIVIDAIDFTEFVSGYAKNNIFKYQESEDEDLRVYNISNFISYGSGNITVDNDYIDNSKDIVESDFTSPITYLNGIFDMSMERINFVELEEIENNTINSVSDSSGIPRFNITNADDIFTVGDLVRIETSLGGYNGEWVINAITSTYITVNGPTFDASTTGTVTLLQHKFTTDDNVYLFVNADNIAPSFFSTGSTILLEENTTSSVASLAYFNLLSNGKQINRIFKQGLSFGEVNNSLSYQLTLLDTYWPLFSRILSDPVKAIASGYLKKSTFEKIKSFLRPIMIQTQETRNLYYMNRNRGYKGSDEPCNIELIKLN